MGRLPKGLQWWPKQFHGGGLGAPPLRRVWLQGEGAHLQEGTAAENSRRMLNKEALQSKQKLKEQEQRRKKRETETQEDSEDTLLRVQAAETPNGYLQEEEAV